MFDIDRIAKLAALNIEPDERAALEHDMAEIVAMVGGLPECDGSLLYGNGGITELRDDCAENSGCTHEELMANAPETMGGCFGVPKTVEC